MIRTESMVIPRWTPWGKPQSADRILDDVALVHTAGHGGLYIRPNSVASRALERTIGNSPFLNEPHWWEEDEDGPLAMAALLLEIDPVDFAPMEYNLECFEETLRRFTRRNPDRPEYARLLERWEHARREGRIR